MSTSKLITIAARPIIPPSSFIRSGHQFNSMRLLTPSSPLPLNRPDPGREKITRKAWKVSGLPPCLFFLSCPADIFEFDSRIRYVHCIKMSPQLRPLAHLSSRHLKQAQIQNLPMQTWFQHPLVPPMMILRRPLLPNLSAWRSVHQ
jgi:hypothetical protein